MKEYDLFQNKVISSLCQPSPFSAQILKVLLRYYKTVPKSYSEEENSIQYLAKTKKEHIRDRKYITISLSCHEKVFLNTLCFERYFSHHRATKMIMSRIFKGKKIWLPNTRQFLVTYLCHVRRFQLMTLMQTHHFCVSKPLLSNCLNFSNYPNQPHCATSSYP